MGISGFPTTGNGGGTSVVAISSLDLNSTTGEVIADFTDSSTGQILYTLPDAINDIEISGNSLDIGLNYGTSYNIPLPNNISSVSTNGNELIFAKSNGESTNITVPTEIVVWESGIDILENTYYTFDDYIWRGVTAHTSTSTFNYANFMLQGDTYIYTYRSNTNVHYHTRNKK